MMENKDILSEITKYLNLKDSTQLRIVNKYFYSQIKAPKPEEIRIFKSEKYLNHVEKTIEMIGFQNNKHISAIVNIIALLYNKNNIIIEHCIKIFEKYKNLEKKFLEGIFFSSLKDANIMFKFLIKKFKINVDAGLIIANDIFPDMSFAEFNDCMENNTEFFIEKINEIYILNRI